MVQKVLGVLDPKTTPLYAIGKNYVIQIWDFEVKTGLRKDIWITKIPWVYIKYALIPRTQDQP